MSGVDPRFSIIDTKDTEDIIELIKTEFNIKSSVPGKQFPRKSNIQNIISKSKNLELSIKETIRKYFDDGVDFEPQINLMDKALTSYKMRSNLLNYEDLMIVLRNSLRDFIPFKKILSKTV